MPTRTAYFTHPLCRDAHHSSSLDAPCPWAFFPRCQACTCIEVPRSSGIQGCPYGKTACPPSFVCIGWRLQPRLLCTPDTPTDVVHVHMHLACMIYTCESRRQPQALATFRHPILCTRGGSGGVRDSTSLMTIAVYKVGRDSSFSARR